MPSPTVSRDRTLILATLCAGTFMGMLDNVVIANALPRMSRDLGIGISGLQWSVEGYSLVFAALLIPGGAVGDRWGRRRIYLGGLLLFTAGSALTASATGVGTLVLGRAVQAVGAAGLVPQALPILRAVFPGRREQARAFARWSAVSALGLALGPLIGGPLVGAFGWPSAFWINIPIGIAAGVLGLRVLPADAGPARRVPFGPADRRAARRVPSGRTASRSPVGLVAQFSLALGLGLFVYVLIEAPAHGWASPAILAASCAAGLAFTVLYLAANHGHAPVGLAVLRDRTARTAVLAGAAISFAMFGLMSFLGLFLQTMLGWSPAGAGIVSLPSTISVILVSPLAGRLTVTRGPRLPLAAGLASLATALLFLSLFGTGARYAAYGWALPLMGAGLGLSYTPVAIVVMRAAPQGGAGGASAIVSASREIGGTAGIAVMGTILTSRFRARLAADLAALHLPGAGAHHILASTSVGGGGGLAAAGSPALGAPVRAAIAQSFVAGLHLALWGASAVLILAAALVWTFVPAGDAPGASDASAAAPAGDAVPSPPHVAGDVDADTGGSPAPSGARSNL